MQLAPARCVLLASGEPGAIVLLVVEEKGLTRDEGFELAQRMFRAAQQSYEEYEHSHNPPTCS